MMTAIAVECGARNIVVTCIEYEQPDEWCFVEGIERGASSFGYWNPTLRSHGAEVQVARRHLLRTMLRHDVFVVVGADVLDGWYSVEQSLRRLGLIRLAAVGGVPVEIVGFSFNAVPAEECCTALRALPDSVHLRARDPLSVARCESRTGRSVELTSDVAFLLQPEEATATAHSTIAWVHARRQEGRIVLGVNVNHLFLSLVPHLSVSGLVEGYRAALEPGLRAGRYAICLLPHDGRGSVSDPQLCAAVQESLAAFGDNVRLVPFPLRAGEVKGIVGHLDAAITGRMHLAIACLGRTTPVACITYQDKFEGLMAHFGLDGHLLSPDESFRSGRLTDLIDRVVARREDTRRRIAERLPHVVGLARRNLSFI